MNSSRLHLRWKRQTVIASVAVGVLFPAALPWCNDGEMNGDATDVKSLVQPSRDVNANGVEVQKMSEAPT